VSIYPKGSAPNFSRALGFPTRTCTKSKNADRILIFLNQDAVWTSARAHQPRRLLAAAAERIANVTRTLDPPSAATAPRWAGSVEPLSQYRSG
jgi:hypothetical protein